MTRLEKEISRAFDAASVAQKAGDKQTFTELGRKADRLINTARALFHSREPKQPAHFIVQRRLA